MSETSKQLPEIKLALGSRPDCRIWRNQVGLAWVGEPPNLRRVTTGLFSGSADLIGIFRYRIEQADVGRSIGVFLSCEVKAGSAKPRPNQRAWMDAIQRMGGIGIWANSADSAVDQIQEWRPMF